MITTKNLLRAGYTPGEWTVIEEDRSIKYRDWTKTISPEITLVVCEDNYSGVSTFCLMTDSFPEELKIGSVTKLLELENLMS